MQPLPLVRRPPRRRHALAVCSLPGTPGRRGAWGGGKGAELPLQGFRLARSLVNEDPVPEGALLPRGEWTCAERREWGTWVGAYDPSIQCKVDHWVREVPGTVMEDRAR